MIADGIVLEKPLQVAGRAAQVNDHVDYSYTPFSPTSVN